MQHLVLDFDDPGRVFGEVLLEGGFFVHRRDNSAMPYIGGKLASLFDHKQVATKLAVRDMADKGGDLLHDKVIENTPIGGVDQAHGAPGGNLRTSWWRKPVNRKVGPLGPEYETEVGTDVDYAPYVEHGTGLWGPDNSEYIIRPRKPGGYLRWKDKETGEWIYAKEVHHPGSPGQHMMELAAAYVEHSWDDHTDPILEEWQRSIESRADL